MYQVFSCVVVVLTASTVFAKFDESLLTDDVKKLLASLHKTCIEQTGADEGNIDKLKAAEFVDDDKTRCYVKCVMSESGAMDENGTIDLAALSEAVPENLREMIKPTFDTCAKRADGLNDHCEKAYTIMKCVHEIAPDNYYIV